MSIELRLSDVAPPEPEPKRTIYRDIVNLPDPVKLGLTIRYFNHDDVGLYFQITGSGTGYSFGTVNLGLLASGANAYQNLDEFASRAKPSSSDLPSGEKEETITLTLKAYTDSGYTNLKWTYNRTITVKFINSADPSYTTDVLNNFDDGTTQGWTATAELNTSCSLGVASDYVLSTPYSLRNDVSGTYTGGAQSRARINKSITTPNKTSIYAIIDLRMHHGGGQGGVENCRVQSYIGTTLTTSIYLGRPYVQQGDPWVPEDKWLRLVVPLPANTTLELRLLQESYAGVGIAWYLWLDDFKVVSK